MANKKLSSNKSSNKFARGKVIKAKNPKKVLAGKIRQATGIKDASGRYVSKIFINEIKKTILSTKKVDVSKIHSDQSDKINELLKDSKISPKEVKKFYEQNKEIFEDLNTFGKLKGTSKNRNQIDKAIDKYKGKMFVNNGTELKEVSKVDLKYQLASFNQLLSSNINLVDFVLRPTFSIDGTMTINLPDIKDFRKEIKKHFRITNMKSLEDFETADIIEGLQTILKGYFGEVTDIILIIS